MKDGHVLDYEAASIVELPKLPWPFSILTFRPVLSIVWDANLYLLISVVVSRQGRNRLPAKGLCWLGSIPPTQRLVHLLGKIHSLTFSIPCWFIRHGWVFKEARNRVSLLNRRGHGVKQGSKITMCIIFWYLLLCPGLSRLGWFVTSRIWSALYRYIACLL